MVGFGVYGHIWYVVEQRKIVRKIVISSTIEVKKLRSREVGCSRYGLRRGPEHANTGSSRLRTVSILSRDRRPFSLCIPPYTTYYQSITHS